MYVDCLLILTISKEGERKVVFMGGLYFQWRRLARSGVSIAYFMISSS